MKFEIGNILVAVIQRVGNKANGEGVSFSSETTSMKDSEGFIQNLIESSFKFNDLKSFEFVESLELNPVYTFTTKIFNDPNTIIKQSNNLARYLYEQSLHPNIKVGEFYVIYFKECQLEGEKVDAIGLFKSESKDTVLKVVNDGTKLTLTPERGMSIKKLDKGCLIFNREKESGYIVATVDNTNNGNDAHYWTDSFLHVVARRDEFHETHNVVNLCKSFIVQERKIRDIPKVEQAYIANRSLEKLNTSESVNINKFAEDLFLDSDTCTRFMEYKREYEQIHGMQIADNFIPVNNAIKRKAMGDLFILKLDKNFEIKIYKGENMIEKGYDNKQGLFFYKLYFEQEQ